MKTEVKLKVVAFVFLSCFFLSEKEREKRTMKEAISTTTMLSVIRFWDVDCSIGLFSSIS